jgi:hypothetical protein
MFDRVEFYQDPDRAPNFDCNCIKRILHKRSHPGYYLHLSHNPRIDPLDKIVNIPQLDTVVATVNRTRPT